MRGRELWGQGHPQGGGRSRSRCQGPRVGSVQRAQCCRLGPAGCLPAGKGFSDSSNIYQLGSSSGAGCVRLSVLPLCLGRRLLLPAEINVCGLPFITPLGAALEVFSRWCWFSSCSLGALEQLGPRLAGWLGWDDGLEVGFHQQGHPSRGLQGGRSSSLGSLRFKGGCVGWERRAATGVGQRAQMTSRSPPQANFLEFHGQGEEVVSDESQTSPVYSSWWHKVAQEVKGFAFHLHRSGFKLIPLTAVMSPSASAPAAAPRDMAAGGRGACCQQNGVLWGQEEACGWHPGRASLLHTPQPAAAVSLRHGDVLVARSAPPRSHSPISHRYGAQRKVLTPHGLGSSRGSSIHELELGPECGDRTRRG